jgi:hypothetical protein
MKWTLHPHDTIQTIQHAFQQFFSHLRPEFYKTPHGVHEASARGEQYLHNITLQQILPNTELLSIPIDPAQSTGEFEQMMQTFGLNVQLFRNQRGTWLQTTNSDSLTLKAQNDRGRDADADILPDTAADIDLA